MCLAPKHIINRFYQPTDHLSPYTITCHCGKCEECHNVRVSETLFRAERMHESVERKGGFAVFVTLTFNNESLNKYIYESCDEHGELTLSSVTTWNNDYFRKWRNSVNMECMRKYGYRLYYLSTAERGSDKFYIDDNGKERQGTSRPHYHVICWFVPQVESRELNAQKAYDIITRHWSHDSGYFGNKTLDISNPKKNECEVKFVASHLPIGIVYNEIVSRTIPEAIKYVVKYCFKDVDETVFHIDNILHSTHKVAYKDACPRLLLSNGIGEDWLLQVFNVDNYEQCAVSMANYVSQNSDGEKLRIPRYYIKKLNAIQGETYCEEVFDFSKEFDGTTYVYKHDEKPNARKPKPLKHVVCDVEHEMVYPIYDDEHHLIDWFKCDFPLYEPTKCYRIISHKHQHRTKFGTIFNSRNLENSANDVYDCMHNWVLQPFNFEKLDFLSSPYVNLKKFPFAVGLPFSRAQDFYKSNLQKSDIFQRVCDYLLDLSPEEFKNLFFIHKHFPRYDELIAQNLEYSAPFLYSAYTWTQLVALRDFLSLREIEKYVNSAVARYNLRVNYENIGLHEAVKKRPFLFEQRIV